MHFPDSISITVGQATDPGVKPVNEDCMGTRIPEDNQLVTKGIAAVISDGVSAATAALEAAEMCVKGFLTDYYSTPDSWKVKTSGQRIITALNSWLTSQSRSNFRDEHKGYVATFSALILKSRTAHLFHVGDSRISRIREGNFEPLTRDHATRISEDVCYLTRAMGLGRELKVDYRTTSIEVGDLFILSTDGIHDHVEPDEIIRIISSAQDLDAAADDLLQAALTNGSKDNLTCLIIRIDHLPSGDENEIHRQLSSRPFPPDLDPGMTIDGLRVENVLDASKNSQLYLVRDQETNLQMVMKTPSVNFQDDPAYIERFLMEEWIGRRVNNRYIAKVLQGSQDPQFLYYLIEHIKGQTLGQWIQRQSSSPDIKQTVRIVSELIDAVRALHRKETLHQDIKPDNIMLDEDEHVKLIDFGSCHIASIQEIQVPYARPTALGTLGFSAPEYRLGTNPTRHSDQFSIAMVTYHMLTGGESPYGVKWEKASSLREFNALEYTSSFRHQPMIPHWMDGALKKALSIQPDSRYEKISEFLHDLKHPNPDFIEARHMPLIERDPVSFWKILTLILAIAFIIALLWR